MQNQPQPDGGYGAELEQALRDFEAAFAELAPGRHAQPEHVEERLAEQRMRVIRLAEALPTVCRPRPACPSCEGQREIHSLQPAPSRNEGGPRFTRRRQLCQPCAGTGFELHLQPPA